MDTPSDQPTPPSSVTVGCDACATTNSVDRRDTRTWFRQHRTNDCPRPDFAAYLVVYP